MIYDIIIIGGGPVGLYAGIQSSLRGLKTLLIEKQQFPVNKLCGEGIFPLGLKSLKKIDFFDDLDSEKYHFLQGISYHLASGETCKADFPDGAGIGLNRSVLSATLHKKALQEDNLEILEGVSVSNIIENDEKEKPADVTYVETTRGNFSGRVIIGADGLFSSVRKMVDFDCKLTKRKRFGLGAHLNQKPWSPFVEIFVRPGCEAYITPTAKNETHVVFLWDKNAELFSDQFDYSFQSFLSFFPELEKKLGVQNFSRSDRKVRGPLEHQVKSVVKNKTVLIGDASGYLDALTGEGITLGFRQAEALLELIKSEQKKSGEVSKQSLMKYEKIHQQVKWSSYWGTEILLWLIKRPALFSIIIKIFNLSPKLFQHVLSANTGVKKSSSEWLRWGFQMFLQGTKVLFGVELGSDLKKTSLEAGEKKIA